MLYINKSIILNIINNMQIAMIMTIIKILCNLNRFAIISFLSSAKKNFV